jgi:transposase-like protein
MGKKNHYSEELKWKAIDMKKAGFSNKQIMDELGIKNVTQVKRWMQWFKENKAYRLAQPIGKQYIYGKGPEDLSEMELLKRQNEQLKMELEILKKYQEIERSWDPKSLFK